MNEKLKTAKKSLKRTFSFRYNPRFEESFSTYINEDEFQAITLLVLRELGWELTFREAGSIEAKTLKNKSYLEKISISFSKSRVSVKSSSIGGSFCDFGINSLRVRLFIEAFKMCKRGALTKKSVSDLTEELQKKDNWKDYKIPDQLPVPKEYKSSNDRGFFRGIAILAIIWSICKAGLSAHYVSINYYVELIHFFTCIVLLTWLIKKLIKQYNYSNFDLLSKSILLLLSLIFILDHVFQYGINQLYASHPDHKISFIYFLQMKYGYNPMLSNPIFLGLIKVAFLFFSYWLSYVVLSFKSSINMLLHSTSTVPEEVTDFAYYWMLRELDDDEIRIKLAEKGWKAKASQDAVFRAIGSHVSLSQVRRE